MARFTSSHALKRRYRRILQFAARALVQTWWFELVLPKFGLRKLIAKGRIGRIQKLAREFYVLAADLGGLMIKLGQFMSSRLDVLPEEITRELAGLQDEVAPEPFEAISAQVSAELGIPLEQAFESFEAEPIAAASLGQAHRAVLGPELADDLGYESVIVKVLRPGIQEIVEVDLRALRRVGGWLSKIRLVSKRADAPKLVEEFATTSYQEIDYLNEAGNLERFANQFVGDLSVSTPEVIWERSSQKVLTLSDVTAIKISDTEALLNADISPEKVAGELARITFEQIFTHGFFHADPHPGNIFVRVNPAGSEREFTLVFIDFGMMGEIDNSLREELQRLIFAIATRDARAWIRSIRALGVLFPSADTVELESAVSELFERFGGVGVAELTQTDPREIREFAIRFSELVRTLPFQLPENFLLLIRSISLISGVTSTLNRQFNMWDAVDPFARTLLSGGANSTLKTLGQELSRQIRTLVQLPRKIDDLIQRVERGEISVRQLEAERRLRQINGSLSRLGSIALFGLLMFAGFEISRENEVLSVLLLIGAGLSLLHALSPWRKW